MTDTEIVGQFLREYLPASLSAQLAPEPPVVMEGTFVDDDLQQNHSDVLVKVRLLDGKEVWPYVLLEHKSTPDEFARLQLLGYVRHAWVRWHLNHQRARLPAIVPIIVHQGPEGWDFSTQLTDLITLDSPEEARSYVMFRHELVDLAAIDDADLPRQQRLRTFLLLMKYIRYKDLSRHLHKVLVHFMTLNALDQRWIFAYINEGPVRVSREELRAALEQVAPGQVEEIMGHITQPYVEEALAKGRDQGQREELAAAVIQILTVRFRSVPADVCERVRAADLATLRTWHVRAVVAPDLESVFKPESSAPRLRAAPEQAAPEHADAEATLAKGREALAAAIIQILAVRFRSVPADVCERVLAADLASLQIWFGKAASAPDLESLFKPASSPPEGGSRDA